MIYAPGDGSSELPAPESDRPSSPFEYARPEHVSGSWAMRDLVTCPPFTEFVKTHPEIGPYRTDISYRVVWSAVSSAGIAAAIPLYCAPKSGRGRDFYERYDGTQNLPMKVKGFEPGALAVLRAQVATPDLLAQLVRTEVYSQSQIDCVFKFLTRVASDVAAIQA